MIMIMILFKWEEKYVGGPSCPMKTRSVMPSSAVGAHVATQSEN